MRYASYLTGSVGKRIESLHQQQIGALSLREEVAVMHEIAGIALGNYSRAMEKAEEVNDLEQRMRIQNMAAAYVVEAMNQVRDMTLAAARVQDSGKAVDMMTVGAAMSQLMQYMEMEARTQLRDPDQFMKRMAEHVNEKFLTVDAVARTSLTPERLDKQVLSMHDSVPEVA